MTYTRKRVGVVGAGVSGVAAAAHLKAAGLDVIVFERSSVAGGVWVFDQRLSPEPSYPSMRPSLAEFALHRDIRSGDYMQESETEIWNHEGDAILFAPPGPCYEGLSNNVPTTLMEMKINPWKPFTAPIVRHNVLAEYIQDTAAKCDVNSYTLYNTRVEHAFKKDEKWYVNTRTLNAGNTNDNGAIKSWDFDALIVATGHYHACRVPDIPGLQDWKRKWPKRIQHSKRYRSPKEYKDKTVLLVGASVSSTDIAKELGPVAKKIYQSSRGGQFDLPAYLLPQNAVRVGSISSFDHPTDSASKIWLKNLDFELPLPGTVTFDDGTTIENIDKVLICTGYHCSLPFLQQYHHDSLLPQNAGDVVLVTNGEQMHNLHKDIFYIPDPTLSFVGVPYHVATFTLFEFQAMAIAAVYSGKAYLPAKAAMKAEYREKVAKKGFGKAFHSLKGKDVEYANSLVDWINGDAGTRGGNMIEGHTQAWHVAFAEFCANLKRSDPFLAIKGEAVLSEAPKLQ